MRIFDGKKIITPILTGFMIYLMAGFPVLVYALPEGGEIVSGDGSIQVPSSQDMIVNQDSGQMIVNWQGFDIGAQESVQFQQPGADSVALNRVIGADPSLILGKLSANGQIFISNPSGVFFGPGSQVDVHGLLASTLRISDQDFLNRTYNFNQDPNRTLASVINEGAINASGYAALLAPAVVNRGTIVANLGSVALASGEAATLDFTGDGLINFIITGEVSGTVTDNEGNVLPDRVRNEGLIRADGGQVTLSALDAGDVIRNVVNQEGIIEARTIAEKEGRIFLSGGDTGIVSVSGTLDASGDDEGELGGTIQVLGEKVGLFDTAHVNVSGDAGGGEALIGGDYQGGGDVPTAFITYVGEDTFIEADAINTGDGGKVIVWADDTARIYGSISATGGALSGNGGFVETSGKNYLDITRTPDLTAANGIAGEWLIDPFNIEIVAGGGNTNIGTTSPFIPGGDSALLGVDLITAALAGGASVTVETGLGGAQAGDITLSTDLNYNGTVNGSLTLNAANHIIFNASIFDADLALADSLNLFLDARFGIFTLAAGQFINTSGFMDIVAGDIVLNGTIDNAGGFTQIRTSGGTIGLADATCGGACDMSLSNVELANISTLGLLIGDGESGDLFVDNLAAGATNVGSTTLLDSGGSINFTGGASVFSGRLFLTAVNGVNIGAQVQTGASGGIGFRAVTDSDGDGAGDFSVSSGGVTTNNGSMAIVTNNFSMADGTLLNAGSGNISILATGGVTLNADGDLMLGSILSGGDVTVTAESGSIFDGNADDPGDNITANTATLVVQTQANIAPDGNELEIIPSDFTTLFLTAPAVVEAPAAEPGSSSTLAGC